MYETGVWPVPLSTAINLCGVNQLAGERCRYLIWPSENVFECVRLDNQKKWLRDQGVMNKQITATGINCSGPPDFIRTGKL